MAVTSGKIKGLLITVVLATLFFAMAPDLVYELSQGVSSFLQMIAGNETLYGAGPAGIATVVKNNWGYFLAVGVLTLVISVVAGIFAMKKRR